MKYVTVVVLFVVALLSGASVHADEIGYTDGAGSVETYNGKHFTVSDPENWRTDDQVTISTDDDGNVSMVENERSGSIAEQE